MTLPVIYQELDWYEGVPRSVRWHTVLGLLLLVGAVGGFGYWASTAPLSAGLISQGSFVATGKNQIVQHLEGGIIAEILVSEGDEVVTGQPLMRLDQTAAYAREEELFLRRARLEGITARLVAMAEGRDDMPLPAFLVDNAGRPQVAEIITSQRHAFDVAQQKLEIDITVLENNAEALKFRLEGFTEQAAKSEELIAIIIQELENKAALLEKGLLRADAVSALRRGLAEAEGQLARLQSQISETQLMLDKSVDQVEQARSAYLNEALEELQLMQAELDSVREQHASAQSVSLRSEIVAPVDGVVVQLKYNTPGGVIEPGKPIAEILPLDAPLIVETMVARADIDSMQVGQEAMIRLVALNQRTTPVLKGEVFYISADAIRDTAAGQASRDVYVARIELPADEIARVPDGFQPLPGMPAEIIIATSERTFLQYVIKPIVDSMARAFREQ
ncbi:HlyD family type I secretion periplasmic adaptor subunit [Tabrizicola sp.]|uniref:HlyD family type I secretion periplasmic adaptor subunit n=1 Tax=Tabrizicola sp. TaxID=2005166 RepID=UPI003F397898